ncbi:MAG: AMP-binding protein [Candidatus Thermoplasmatota archaeon]|nr:AMP-binding protein [Candidatus Thermoplasmatota archaeon]
MKGIVWQPTDSFVEEANITRFMAKHGLASHDELLRRSVEDNEWFWEAALEDLGVEWYKPPDRVLDMREGKPWARWFPGGKINLAHNGLDRHATGPARDRTACIWESDEGISRRTTYRDHYVEANRLAHALVSAEVEPGDTIGIYMPMVPEVISLLFACWKVGAIAVPIFSGFAAKATAIRLDDAGAKILFTADGYHRRGKTIRLKEEADRAADLAPNIERLIVLEHLGHPVPWNEERDVSWSEFLRDQPEEFETRPLDSEHYSMIVYTSGTTGRPKGAVHTHIGAIAQATKEIGYGFDLKPRDVFFWVTDIGWMMGPWMIIGVSTLGGTMVMMEGTVDYPKPDRLWRMVDDHRVTQLGISPTAIRLLMKYGEGWVEKHDLSSLRLLGSTGEPWDKESWMWFFEKIGGGRAPIINISGGTEILGCFLFPLPIVGLKPTTLGRGPALGMDVDVLDEEGRSIRGERGYLVARSPCPSMTKGLWKDPDRYLETYWSRFEDVWDHGDWAVVDEDGYWFLQGRSDDTINVAGKRIGPSEVEGALISHPAVLEAAVIGVPDPLKGEALVAFVVVADGQEASDTLEDELIAHVASELGKTMRPQEVYAVSALPKTRSAKIVRRLIKATFLGQELGDLSSVENPEALQEIPVAGGQRALR